MTVTVFAPAKVNLTLDVLGRRPDGYHEIATVMQAVDLGDTVTLTPDRSGRVSVEVKGARLPLDRHNTAVAAALAYLRRVGKTRYGVKITLDKKVPMQAGMAGGSADAAGVLVGLDQLTGGNLGLQALCELGADVGADVPFCVMGGTALATGTGTRLTPLTPLPDCWILAVKPPVGVSTAAAYMAIDSAPMLYRPDNDGMCRALQQGRLPRIGRLMCNVFEHALALPEVETAVGAVREFAPLGCCMTCSGSVVFALFGEEQAAGTCADALREQGYDRVYVCRPFRAGAQVIKISEE